MIIIKSYKWPAITKLQLELFMGQIRSSKKKIRFVLGSGLT